MDKKIDIIQFKDAGAVFLDGKYYMFYQGLKTPRAVSKELDKITKNRQIHLKTKWMLLADNWMFSKNLDKALEDIAEAVVGIEIQAK